MRPTLIIVLVTRTELLVKCFVIIDSLDLGKTLGHEAHCYDLALKSGHFQGYWSTDIPKAELRVVRLQFLIATADLDDEEMPKPAGQGPNDEEEIKECHASTGTWSELS